MFFTNLFSYSSRRRMCEHAYRSTLADLRARRDVLGPVFERHGLKLRDAVLDDPHPSLIKGLPPMPMATETNAQLRQDRKSVVKGKSVSERVDIGGRRIIKKKKQKY